MWLAYCAMAAAIVPLVLMGIGYFFMGRSADDAGKTGESTKPPLELPPEGGS
jgi:hypothetical protein